LVEPYDEDEIDDQHRIIRRVNVKQHVVWDKNLNKNRLSSKLYSKSSGLTEGMSVDIEALIVAAGEDPVEYVTTPVFTGSVVFQAGKARALDLMVGYEPIIDEEGFPDNPYHGEVWLKTAKKQFSSSQKDGLAKAASWYVEIDDVELVS